MATVLMTGATGQIGTRLRPCLRPRYARATLSDIEPVDGLAYSGEALPLMYRSEHAAKDCAERVPAGQAGPFCRTSLTATPSGQV